MRLMNLDIKNTEPFFVNEEGIEWYLVDDMTKWCTMGKCGWPILDAKVFLTVEDGKMMEYVIVAPEGKVLGSNKSMEGIAVLIEALRLAMKM